ncbi:hypothetical protein HAX54_045362, partial [Datura stramonium]|nr:hypothetical protein [Datura stramonium]
MSWSGVYTWVVTLYLCFACGMQMRHIYKAESLGPGTSICVTSVFHIWRSVARRWN